MMRFTLHISLVEPCYPIIAKYTFLVDTIQTAGTKFTCVLLHSKSVHVGPKRDQLGAELVLHHFGLLSCHTNISACL